jgi:hypothetical protein
MSRYICFINLKHLIFWNGGSILMKEWKRDTATLPTQMHVSLSVVRLGRMRYAARGPREKGSMYAFPQRPNFTATDGWIAACPHAAGPPAAAGPGPCAPQPERRVHSASPRQHYIGKLDLVRRTGTARSRPRPCIRRTARSMTRSRHSVTPYVFRFAGSR